MNLPTISLGKYIESFVNWLNVHVYEPFDLLSMIMDAAIAQVEKVLLFAPAWLMIVQFLVTFLPKTFTDNSAPISTK